MTRKPNLRHTAQRLMRLITRGRRHRRRLADIDTRVAVMGTRGKTSLVTWLHEALVDRDYDTYAKITGEQPYSLYNGEMRLIERTGPTKLYETERELRRFEPEDAIVVENQGIRKYTTRLVNEDYIDPTVVVLTNVRHDHLDTLGKDAFEIARAFARAVPSGSRVVTAERNPVLAEYLERELSRRNATLTRIINGEKDSTDPGEELVLLLDAALEHADATQLTREEKEKFRRRFEVRWTTVPGGRIYNAANVNDVESTDLMRRALQSENPETFQPLVYLRADRPGRTKSFIGYLNWLADQNLIEQVRCVGAHQSVAMRSLGVPVVVHNEETETPREVLEEALADGWPVIVMANSAPEFMQKLSTEIDRRARPSEELIP